MALGQYLSNETRPETVSDESATMPTLAEVQNTYEREESHEESREFMITEIAAYVIEVYLLEDENVSHYNEACSIPVYKIPTRTPGEYRTKIISLTFDDGPSWLTEYLLNILDQHDARVTFCVIGNLVEANAETVVRAFEAGHEIVGHSWNHGNLSQLSVYNITTQIEQTSKIIEYVTGESPPPLFRVPFGIFNGRIRRAAYESGYGVLNWSIDPQDWRYRCTYHIYEYIMQNARDGAIVLLHDIHPTTIYAMEKVIPSLIDSGFRLVHASEVIYHIYGELEPGFEYTGTRR